jgi:PIN domain nuclease of toxin-antitoxin system
VKLLLDTRILLWWLGEDDALPTRARQAIADADTAVFVSAATAWEIAIMKATGRLDAPDDLLEACEVNDFGTLAITAGHALAAGVLPPHHSDPFDRVLIARAHLETMTLVTVDNAFSRYEVDILP